MLEARVFVPARSFGCSFSVRIGHVPMIAEAGANHRSMNVSHPVLPFRPCRSFRLLERIVDGYRKAVRLLARRCIAFVIPSRKNASAFCLLPWR